MSFDKDSIDQSPQLSYLLARRFPSAQGGPRVASTKLPVRAFGRVCVFVCVRPPAMLVGPCS